jgi:hypothetical protein
MQNLTAFPFRKKILNQNRNLSFLWETNKLFIFFEIFEKIEQIPEILSLQALATDKNS